MIQLQRDGPLALPVVLHYEVLQILSRIIYAIHISYNVTKYCELSLIGEMQPP